MFLSLTHTPQKSPAGNHMLINTYAQLKKIAQKFAAGSLTRIAVCGSPGVGKTTAFESSIVHPFVVIRGHCAPSVLYEELYRGQSLPVLIDDAEAMLRDKSACEIVRDLIDTVAGGQVSWRTRSPFFAKLGLPQSFTTTNPCCVLTNRIGTGPVWDAILSRAAIFYFEPDWDEVLDNMAGWFKDTETLDFSRSVQDQLGIPDARRLIKAKQIKDAGLAHFSWKDCLSSDPSAVGQPSHSVSLAEEVVLDLLRNPTLSSGQRVHDFQVRTGKSRASFFRVQRRLGQGLAEPLPSESIGAA